MEGNTALLKEAICQEKCEAREVIVLVAVADVIRRSANNAIRVVFDIIKAIEAVVQVTPVDQRRVYPVIPVSIVFENSDEILVGDKEVR